MSDNSKLIIGGLAAFLLWKYFKSGGESLSFLGGSGGGGGADVTGGDIVSSGDDTIPATSNDDIGYTSQNTTIRSAGAPNTTIRVQTANQRTLSADALQKYPLLANFPLTSNTIRLANRGAIKQSTYDSMASFAALKADPLNADFYAWAGGANAMPGIDPEAYNAADRAMYSSQGYINHAAIVYYAGQTGAHRGAMGYEERRAWDSSNLTAALSAYSAAGGYTGQHGASFNKQAILNNSTTNTQKSAFKSPTAIINKPGGNSKKSAVKVMPR